MDIRRKALVVGIDHYTSSSLSGCANDAKRMKKLLEKNGDGSPNFAVQFIMSSEKNEITTELLHSAITKLFSGTEDTVLFYFAGHGLIDSDTHNGYIVTQDGSKPNWGIELETIIKFANESYPRIKSSVIILDCCHSGIAGELSYTYRDNSISKIGKGVTVLTACQKDGEAGEANGHGIFTDILLEGLDNAASDIVGRITPASLYAHIDQTLGPWEQRPIYKANVENFITIRKVLPKVSEEILRRLPELFPCESDIFKLDPSFEPDRGEETGKLQDIPVNPDNVTIYRHLQKCNRFGLVVPSSHEHMWHSAVFSGGCKLTAVGKHYRRLVTRGRI